MKKERLQELRKKGKHLEPVVRIGKSGLTNTAVEQINRVLKKRRLVKVKLLRSFVEQHDRKEAAKELSQRLNAELIEQTGFIVVLYRENPGQEE